jgi:chromosome segregation ATPase
MSEFLKKIKSVFIEDTEPTGSNKPAQPAKEQPAQATPAAPAPVAQATGGGGAVSDKFVEILSAALEKNNQEGFDYLEFRQALKNLSKMAMDESTRYQSAYAMAQTMGVTSTKLIESANFYLQVLGGEQSKFNEAHAQQRSRLIGSREEDVKSLEAQIQQKTEQIQQLTQQIEEHRRQSEQIREEISNNTLKIEATKADFDATFNSVARHIQDDVAKMKQFMG